MLHLLCHGGRRSLEILHACLQASGSILAHIRQIRDLSNEVCQVSVCACCLLLVSCVLHTSPLLAWTW